MFDWLIDWVNSQIAALQAWVSSALANITQVWNTFVTNVTNVWYNFVTNVTNVWETIVQNITNVWYNITNNITNFVTNVTQNVSNFVTNVTRNVYETVNNITQNVTNVIGLTLTDVKGWFAGIGGATMSWVDSLFVRSGNVWQTITFSLDAWFKTQLVQLNDTFGWVNTLRNRLEEFWTDPEDWLYKAVDRIIERYW